MFTSKFPQIVVLAFLSTRLMVSCRDIGGGLERRSEFLTNAIIDSHHYKRHYRFHNYCSQNQVEIVGHSVNAKGVPNSPGTKLRVQTVNYKNHYGINIISEQSGKFICFNKKSKLITRISGANNPRCIFEEEYSPNRMHMLLRSVYNKDWHVGFNKRGKPLLGVDYGNLRRDQRCYFFKKLGHNYMHHMHKYNGPKVKKDKLTEKLHGYIKDRHHETRNTQSTT